MNIIGIDPSLCSTGMTINGKLFNFVSEEKVFSKKGMTKWYKLAEPFINYKYIKHSKKTENYSEDEVLKMLDYEKITDYIIDTIINEIDDSETQIGIESYSYNSAAGDIIDLVTFSTLLRYKLYNKISKNLIIIPPATLKKEAAKMTYLPEKKGKNIIYRNHFGIPGGHFQKREMYLSLIDNEKYVEKDNYVKFIKELKDDLISISNFPKPFDDCNDSYIIYKYVYNLFI